MADVNPQHRSLRIASHNTQGLNSQSKRRKAFQSYHARGLDVVLLQETHFPTSYTPSFLHRNFPTFYLANTDSQKRGVAILLAKRIPFILSHTVKDPDGRYILIKGLIEGVMHTIISYYAPNLRPSALFFLHVVNPLPLARRESDYGRRIQHHF